MSDQLTTTQPQNRILTAEQFHQLAEVPAVIEWLANFTSKGTRRVYRDCIAQFNAFVGITRPDEYRSVTKAHVIAWRDALIEAADAPATVRRKLSALSSLFSYLANKNAVEINPVSGVKRPSVESNIGKTNPLSDDQAKRLLAAPEGDGIKAIRDRAILTAHLYQGIRRDELARLDVRSRVERRGIKHLAVLGKGEKLRYIPEHPAVTEAVEDYLAAAGHGDDPTAPLFQPVKNNTTNELEKHLTGDGLYKIVKSYAAAAGINPDAVHPHAFRTTAATNAIENDAPLNRVQGFLGHANISTTRLYDHSKERPQDSAVHHVRY
ncbi:MAG: tyrosine-type recombinase/integrase [Phycisphaeraceae bacterium]